MAKEIKVKKAIKKSAKKVVKPKKKEMVNHPSHYNSGKIEVIDFIEDQKFGFNSGNAVKYISRASHKGKEIEDLKKSIWYLEREVSLLLAGVK